jgi:mannose-6-phosphate isomerase
MDVICFDEEFNHPVNFKIQNKIFSQDLNLLELSDFNLFSYSKKDYFEMEIEFGERYASVLLLDGELLIERDLLSHKMKKYQAVLLPIEKVNKFKVSGKGIFLIIK